MSQWRNLPASYLVVEGPRDSKKDPLMADNDEVFSRMKEQLGRLRAV